MDLNLRRLDLDVQRMDATVQLMATSVGALSEDVKQLGVYVQRLECELDYSRRVLDFHLHKIMNRIDVPFVDTLHSRCPDDPPIDDERSSAPG